MKIVHDWLFLECFWKQVSIVQMWDTYLINSIIFQEQYQLLELVGFHLEEMPMKKFVLVHPWSNFTALLPFMDPQLHTQLRLNWQNYWGKMVLIQFKKLLEWTTDIVKCSSCNKNIIDNKVSKLWSKLVEGLGTIANNKQKTQLQFKDGNEIICL